MPNYRLRHYDPATGDETPQWGFYNSRQKIQIFGGAFANGKTTALVVKALGLVKDYPGSNGLLARATYPKLNDTLRKEFLSWCPPEWIRRKPTQDDNTCYMVNGTVVNFRYVAQKGKQREDGTTTSNLLSATYDWIGVDQVEDPEISHKDMLDLMGRLRGSTTYRPPEGDDKTMPSTGPRWLMLTCNPSHGWFYREIVQPYIIWKIKGLPTEKLLVDSDSQMPIIDLYEGSTYTNAENLEPDYIRGLESSYKGQMRDRYLLGKWAAFEGLVYPEFSQDVNMIPREVAWGHLMGCLKNHVEVKVIEGYDFGLASPSCYLFGFIDHLGRVFVMDGYYIPEFKYDKQPGAITDIRSKYASYLEIEDPIWADPSIFRRQVIAGHKATGDTLAKLYKEMGIRMRPASNDITSGIAKVNAYIGGSVNTPHILTGETPGPMLYIVDDLQWYSDEVFSYFWKRNPQGMQIDEPIDGKDHAMDATKYMLAKLPSPSEVIVKRNAQTPEWMFWREVEAESV